MPSPNECIPHRRHNRHHCKCLVQCKNVAPPWHILNCEIPIPVQLVFALTILIPFACAAWFLWWSQMRLCLIKPPYTHPCSFSSTKDAARDHWSLSRAFASLETDFVVQRYNLYGADTFSNLVQCGVHMQLFRPHAENACNALCHCFSRRWNAYH